jgi:ribosomal-protein-alanine N-acetyltransferase
VWVRSYEPGDFEAAYRLDQSCYPPGIAYSRYALREFLTALGSRAWVTQERPGELAGLVIVRQMGPDRGHIITLDIHVKQRRKGLGSRLLKTAEEWLRSQGVRRVRLEAAVSNQTALAFWQGAGYQTVGRLRQYYPGRVDAYRMEKGLG